MESLGHNCSADRCGVTILAMTGTPGTPVALPLFLDPSPSTGKVQISALHPQVPT
jgi:hypothetical protein